MSYATAKAQLVSMIKSALTNAEEGTGRLNARAVPRTRGNKLRFSITGGSKRRDPALGPTLYWQDMRLEIVYPAGWPDMDVEIETNLNTLRETLEVQRNYDVDNTTLINVAFGASDREVQDGAVLSVSQFTILYYA